MLNYRLILAFCFLNSFITNAQKDTDQISFTLYLNNLRSVCQTKDTTKLHELIGDKATKVSCNNKIDSVLYTSNWLTFTSHFNLNNSPEKSYFWYFLLEYSENGFYFDSINLQYTLPNYHYWGTGYPYKSVGLADKYKILKDDILTVCVGTQLSNCVNQSFIPNAIQMNSHYHYNFQAITDSYSICYDTISGNEIGFISSKDFRYYNNYFVFQLIDNQWKLIYYSYCELIDK